MKRKIIEKKASQSVISLISITIISTVIGSIIFNAIFNQEVLSIESSVIKKFLVILNFISDNWLVLVLLSATLLAFSEGYRYILRKRYGSALRLSRDCINKSEEIIQRKGGIDNENKTTSKR